MASTKVDVRPNSVHSADASQSSVGSSETSTSDTQSERNLAPITSASNEETTPQASPNASATNLEASVNSETDSKGGLPSSKSQTTNMKVSNHPLPSGVQRTISETMENGNDADSPVMNETLSVIDEHITDLSTPRHSFADLEKRNVNDSGSDYSGHMGRRLSYIPGTETDEEEDIEFNEATVRGWDHTRTAQQLRQLGVDPKHCNIFEEQEITGDVLLEMDQDFIFMRDFDFGVMGRRLKTWHAIKSFQEEVKGTKTVKSSTSIYSDRNTSYSEPDHSQIRNGTGAFLPKIPSFADGPVHSPRQKRAVSSPKPSVATNVSSASSNIPSPLSPLNQSGTQSNLSKPSAASVRQINHARRHSSIDNTRRFSNHEQRATSSISNSTLGSREKSSFDRGWTMANASQSANHRPGTSLGTYGEAAEFPTFQKRRPSTSQCSVARDSGADLDRGYFSGGEIESRRSRNVLRKRESGGFRSFSHSRQSSAATNVKQKSDKRHSRINSTNSARESVPNMSSARASRHSSSLHAKSGVFDDHATNSTESPHYSPTVTNLEGSTSPSSGIFSPFSSLHKGTNGDSSGRSSPLPSAHLKYVAPKMRRAIGLRAISDAATGSQKQSISSPTSTSNSKDSPKSPSRTNSGTRSGTSKSIDADSANGSPGTADGAFPLFTLPKNSSNVRTKSKKDTSAYIRGLEKKTPQEQMVGCDYCGWMKKKSSHLMTTWKSRLFVLRGRRLSYYYSENDTEERGLIDISSHRVFRADQDTITSLHATITGAKASATPPSGSKNLPSSTYQARPKSSSSDSPFIFKLVPPKAGLSRAVQFTKPSVHFFQVDNIQQGRLWMAALMKATIERDLNLPVKTSNKQKTISLKQAAATNQRPPALHNEGNKEANTVKVSMDSTQRAKNGETGEAREKEESDKTSEFKGLGDFRAVSPSLQSESIPHLKHD